MKNFIGTKIPAGCCRARQILQFDAWVHFGQFFFMFITKFPEPSALPAYFGKMASFEVCFYFQKIKVKEKRAKAKKDHESNVLSKTF